MDLHSRPDLVSYESDMDRSTHSVSDMNKGEPYLDRPIYSRPYIDSFESDVDGLDPSLPGLDLYDPDLDGHVNSRLFTLE